MPLDNYLYIKKRKQPSAYDESILDEAILPKKAWYVVAFLTIFVKISIVFSEHASQGPTGIMPYLVGMGSSLTTLLAYVRDIPTLIACSVLISLYYMLRTTLLAGGPKRAL